MDLTAYALSQDSHEILLASKLVNSKRSEIRLTALYNINMPVKFTVSRSGEEVFKTTLIEPALRRYNSYIDYI